MPFAFILAPTKGTFFFLKATHGSSVLSCCVRLATLAKDNVAAEVKEIK